MTKRRLVLLVSLSLTLTIGTATVGLIYAMSTNSTSTTKRRWNNTPPQTTRPFAEKDIVGSWKYVDRNQVDTAITITFNADGTFDQRIGAERTQHGFWAIRPNEITKASHRDFMEGKLNVYSVLMKIGGEWKVHERDWWNIVDSDLRAGQFAIVGGSSPDPDGYEEFVKLPDPSK